MKTENHTRFDTELCSLVTETGVIQQNYQPLSFCIITNGQRPAMLHAVIASIRGQQIPAFEIIISGNCQPEEGVVYLPCRDAATGGYLGQMRNLAVARAKHENIVLLDDDIVLSPSWYRSFCEYGKPFDILTSQVRLPDGGRYWDHATIGGPRGHVILTENEDDEFVYMTGGGGWVMRREVAATIKWDDSRAFYQGEDVDFSRRCQARGFQISHNHQMMVFHADASYTCVGRRVCRRAQGWTPRSAERLLSQLSSMGVIKKVISLQVGGKTAEAADLLRLARLRHPFSSFFKIMSWLFFKLYGGRLPHESWFPEDDPTYRDALSKLPS